QVLGALCVHRLGFGALHLTGPRSLGGRPTDPVAAVQLVRWVVELGGSHPGTGSSEKPLPDQHPSPSLRPASPRQGAASAPDRGGGGVVRWTSASYRNGRSANSRSR